MTVQPFNGSPAVWRGPEIAAKGDWIRRLSDSEIAELGAALAIVRDAGLTMEALTAEQFPLPEVGPVLAEVRRELEHGRGFQVLRGFPVHRYDMDDLRLLYWGLGLHLGTAMPQSARNDLVGDVRNLNISIHGQRGRGYTSNEALSYHSDSCDVTVLFCLQQAKTGGNSLIASSITVHDCMLTQRPDLVEVLYRPMPFSRMGSEHPSQPRWYRAPVFSVYEGYFCGQYTRVAAEGVRHLAEAEQPTPEQVEAAALLEKIAADAENVLSFRLEPGDLQFVNNHVTFHNRTRFEDGPEPDRRRHLLRLWLSVPDSRPLHPAMSELYRDTRPGAVRGGYLTKDLPPRFTTVDVAELR